MFRKMRRYKQALGRDECEEILNSEAHGVLALLGDNNYPYAIPMSHVYADGKLYFHGAMEGHKNTAVKNCNKASYCVIDKGFKNDDGWSYTYKSVIVFGKIKTITDKSLKEEKLTCLGDKFFPTHEETVNEIRKLIDKTEVFELTAEHMTGKTVEEK